RTAPPPSTTLFPYTTLFRSSHAREEWQVAHAEVEQNDRNRHVGDVPAHDVTQLMSKYETLLFFCERVDGAGIHDDERVVEADGRSEERRVGKECKSRLWPDR